MSTTCAVARAGLQLVRRLLHMRGALAAPAHPVPLGLVCHARVPSSCVGVRHLLGDVGCSAVSWIVFIILTMCVVQVSLAVQVGVAILHARGGLLDFTSR